MININNYTEKELCNTANVAIKEVLPIITQRVATMNVSEIETVKTVLGATAVAMRVWLDNNPNATELEFMEAMSVL